MIGRAIAMASPNSGAPPCDTRLRGSDPTKAQAAATVTATQPRESRRAM